MFPAGVTQKELQARTMSFFNVARVFAYPTAAIVLLAYLVVGYAVYAHLNRTWPIDDPRMLIPGMGFIAIWPGAALLAFSLAYRRRMMRYEFYTLATIASLGVLLLPAIFASALFLDW